MEPANPTLPSMIHGNRPGRWAWLAAVAALIALKLWLVQAQTIFAIGYADHDDALFLNRAADLIRGEWLGPYHQLTLAHAPAYPLFIALAYTVGVPLFLAQHLLYVVACVLLVAAVRPLLPGRLVRFALFAALLYNPVTFDCLYHGRVLRQNILPGLSLLILAGIIGYYARRGESTRRRLPWILLGATVLPAFWMTRNESVWILPSLGLIAAWTAVAIVREARPDRWRRVAWLGVPALGWALGLAAVSGQNLLHYGVFTVTEFKQKDFEDAYGALCRVEPKQWRQFIHVPREVRERLYPLSPAFAELQPHLEGEIGLGWAGISEMVHHIPAKEREIGAGWFMWALRDSVIKAGHGGSATSVAAYYRRLADEINDACDRGLIAAGPRRSGFLPPLRPEHWRPFKRAFESARRMIQRFSQMSVHTPPSEGTADDFWQYARLTGGRISPPADGRPPQTPPVWQQENRLRVLGLAYRAYRAVVPWSGKAALLALAAAAILAIRRRRVPFFGVVSVALAGSIAALAAIVALVDATSFSALNTGYLSGAYGFWILFQFTCWLALAEVWHRDPAGS